MNSILKVIINFKPNNCHNDPNFSKRLVRANSVDQDQDAVWSGLHCLPLSLYLLDTQVYGNSFQILG